MLTQTIDPEYCREKVRQIKKLVPTVLAQRGLLARFKSWRLSQDPETGLVVLFGSLNDGYIATHGQNPASDYFDPILLLELATDLQVQIIPSNSDGLRYAFILYRGELDEASTQLDLPALKPVQLAAEETKSSEPIVLVWPEQLRNPSLR